MAINFDQLDEGTKKKLQDLATLSQNLEFLAQQKAQLETSMREADLAIEELEKSNEDVVVYKNIGGILIKSERNKLLDEKRSLKKMLEMRIKTLDQKMERTKSTLESMQKSLQNIFQNK
ncbi:MAG: prefoldin subunit [Promethearchaeota archaeon]